MPMTDSTGLSMPVSSVPGHDDICSAPHFSVTLVVRPSQPPMLCRAIRVSGVSAATMTKNCSTSL